MLPNANRLTLKKDFDLVFKKGKGLNGDFLIFKALKNNLKQTRVGFVVSKKVSNKATIRNKVKRRLRAVILEELKKSNPSADIIIIALPQAKDKGLLEIQKAIAKFLKNV